MCVERFHGTSLHIESSFFYKELREIAIINSKGKLIYEAFIPEHLDNYQSLLKQQPLKDILLEFQAITRNKLLVLKNTG